MTLDQLIEKLDKELNLVDLSKSKLNTHYNYLANVCSYYLLKDALEKFKEAIKQEALNTSTPLSELREFTPLQSFIEAIGPCYHHDPSHKLNEVFYQLALDLSEVSGKAWHEILIPTLRPENYENIVSGQEIHELHPKQFILSDDKTRFISIAGAFEHLDNSGIIIDDSRHITFELTFETEAKLTALPVKSIDRTHFEKAYREWLTKQYIETYQTAGVEKDIKPSPNVTFEQFKKVFEEYNDLHAQHYQTFSDYCTKWQEKNKDNLKNCFLVAKVLKTEDVSTVLDDFFHSSHNNKQATPNTEDDWYFFGYDAEGNLISGNMDAYLDQLLFVKNQVVTHGTKTDHDSLKDCILKYLNRNSRARLSPSELKRVLQHSKASRQYYDTYHAIISQKNKNTVASHINTLLTGLERGNVKHKGSELISGDPADKAVDKFLNFWNKLDQASQDKIGRLSTKDKANTLNNIIRNRLISTKNNYRSVNYCVKITGDIIKKIVDDNPEIYSWYITNSTESSKLSIALNQANSQKAVLYKKAQKNFKKNYCPIIDDKSLVEALSVLPVPVSKEEIQPISLLALKSGGNPLIEKVFSDTQPADLTIETARRWLKQFPTIYHCDLLKACINSPKTKMVLSDLSQFIALLELAKEENRIDILNSMNDSYLNIFFPFLHDEIKRSFFKKNQQAIKYNYIINDFDRLISLLKLFPQAERYKIFEKLYILNSETFKDGCFLNACITSLKKAVQLRSLFTKEEQGIFSNQMFHWKLNWNHLDKDDFHSLLKLLSFQDEKIIIQFLTQHAEVIRSFIKNSYDVEQIFDIISDQKNFLTMVNLFLPKKPLYYFGDVNHLLAAIKFKNNTKQNDWLNQKFVFLVKNFPREASTLFSMLTPEQQSNTNQNVHLMSHACIHNGFLRHYLSSFNDEDQGKERKQALELLSKRLEFADFTQLENLNNQTTTVANKDYAINEYILSALACSNNLAILLLLRTQLNTLNLNQYAEELYKLIISKLETSDELELLLVITKKQERLSLVQKIGIEKIRSLFANDYIKFIIDKLIVHLPYGDQIKWLPDHWETLINKCSTGFDCITLIRALKKAKSHCNDTVKSNEAYLVFKRLVTLPHLDIDIHDLKDAFGPKHKDYLDRYLNEQSNPFETFNRIRAGIRFEEPIQFLELFSQDYQFKFALMLVIEKLCGPGSSNNISTQINSNALFQSLTEKGRRVLLKLLTLDPRYYTNADSAKVTFGALCEILSVLDAKQQKAVIDLIGIDRLTSLIKTVDMEMYGSKIILNLKPENQSYFIHLALDRGLETICHLKSNIVRKYVLENQVELFAKQVTSWRTFSTAYFLVPDGQLYNFFAAMNKPILIKMLSVLAPRSRAVLYSELKINPNYKGSDLYLSIEKYLNPNQSEVLNFARLNKCDPVALLEKLQVNVKTNYLIHQEAIAKAIDAYCSYLTTEIKALPEHSNESLNPTQETRYAQLKLQSLYLEDLINRLQTNNCNDLPKKQAVDNFKRHAEYLTEVYLPKDRYYAVKLVAVILSCLLVLPGVIAVPLFFHEKRRRQVIKNENKQLLDNVSNAISNQLKNR